MHLTDHQEAELDLTVRTRTVGDFTVVAVSGEVDVVAAPTLRQLLNEAIADGGKRLVVDLTDVPFLDSTGLGVLVGRLKVIRQQGGELRLVIASDRLLRNFRITGLDKVFGIFPTAQDAVADDL